MHFVFQLFPVFPVDCDDYGLISYTTSSISAISELLTYGKVKLFNSFRPFHTVYILQGCKMPGPMFLNGIHIKKL